MGFLNELGRLVQGKPMYTPEDVKSEEQQFTATTTPGVNPRNVIPVVSLTEADTRPDGNKVDIYGTVKNESSETLRVKAIHLLGMDRKLDIELSPRESNEVLLFNNVPKLRSQPKGQANLDYVTESGNYLQSRHEIRYERENDGDFIITDFVLRLPIKDI